RAVRDAATPLVRADLDQIRAALPDVERLGADSGDPVGAGWNLDDAVEVLAGRQHSPLRAVGAVASLVETLDVDRGDEAPLLMPMATISVTEDMATAMLVNVFWAAWGLAMLGVVIRAATWQPTE